MEKNTDSQLHSTLTLKGERGGGLFLIKDHVVVITGGTGVLGRAIAKYLAAEGAKVVILGRKQEVGEAIVADIVAAGGEACFMITDVLNRATVQQNCDDILGYFLCYP